MCDGNGFGKAPIRDCRWAMAVGGAPHIYPQLAPVVGRLKGCGKSSLGFQ